ncbi:uncharacterized protein BP01DRAFT_384157 [Aspergillus saccharolyticus JOP 1030-1]|uniref:Uncharacterized protein n=1 Tax=Aspergillus saccharolyticus JOP 1030-1 TaxID=1450539 RepID=A0A318ZGR8_9EURO|nr:hypothetical protein BP01DRAFT_384157 [Aspergillus saccharolyticus JOP 1030-1]PYH43773.1 hypothetical protein BP01DRAFT_384157 [Aspergillus saccharolyticus JOP 1030-1]
MRGYQFRRNAAIISGGRSVVATYTTRAQLVANGLDHQRRSRSVTWRPGDVLLDELDLDFANSDPLEWVHTVAIVVTHPYEELLARLAAAKAMFDALPPFSFLCSLGTYDMGIFPGVLDRHGPALTELQLHQQEPRYWSVERRVLSQEGHIAPTIPAEVIATMATQCPILHRRRSRRAHSSHWSRKISSTMMELLSIFMPGGLPSTAP